MNPFRKSREFSLYRQMVFGDRAGAPDQRNPLWKHAFVKSASQPTPDAGTPGEGPAQSETEIE